MEVLAVYAFSREEEIARAQVSPDEVRFLVDGRAVDADTVAAHVNAGCPESADGCSDPGRWFITQAYALQVELSGA